MERTWTKPSFEELSVSGECTAYAGATGLGPARRAVRPGATEPGQTQNATVRDEAVVGRPAPAVG
jgi:coenzyme PQQ precursor peptide PqqA